MLQLYCRLSYHLIIIQCSFLLCTKRISIRDLYCSFVISTEIFIEMKKKVKNLIDTRKTTRNRHWINSCCSLYIWCVYVETRKQQEKIENVLFVWFTFVKKCPHIYYNHSTCYVQSTNTKKEHEKGKKNKRNLNLVQRFQRP